MNTSNHHRRTFEVENSGEAKEFVSTVVVALIGCLSGTVLILMIIICVCLVRGSPGYSNMRKSKPSNNPAHTREGSCHDIWKYIYRLKSGLYL